jgi:hypothetical protein
VDKYQALRSFFELLLPSGPAGYNGPNRNYLVDKRKLWGGGQLGRFPKKRLKEAW